MKPPIEEENHPEMEILEFNGVDFTDLLSTINSLKEKEESYDLKRSLVLCDIMYSDEYKKLMSIFNALFKLKEYSERSYNIVNEVIETVPSYYTAWVYKLELVLKLNKDISEELSWLDEFSLDNLKNYQIWSYRIELIKEYYKKDTSKEAFKSLLQKENVLTMVMFDEDAKNHHVWSYKSWFINYFDYDLEEYGEEVAYIGKLIDKDVLNNSAWCFRYKIICDLLKKSNNDQKKSLLEEELEYSEEQIARYPDNISSWNYHFRMIELMKENEHTINKDLSELYETHLNESVYSIEYYAKYLVMVDKASNRKSIKDLYILLRDHRDPIRKVYWDYKIAQL